MLVLGIVLLVIGGFIAYFGRPREQLIFYAGVIIFVIGAGMLVIWAINAADANTELDVVLLGPVSCLLRRVARKLDGQQEVIVPPGGYVFWSYAPTAPSAKWHPPSTMKVDLSGGHKVDLN